MTRTNLRTAVAVIVIVSGVNCFLYANPFERLVVATPTTTPTSTAP